MDEFGTRLLSRHTAETLMVAGLLVAYRRHDRLPLRLQKPAQVNSLHVTSRLFYRPGVIRRADISAQRLDVPALRRLHIPISKVGKSVAKSRSNKIVLVPWIFDRLEKVDRLDKTLPSAGVHRRRKRAKPSRK